ncbi:hypothetical protein ACTHGU_18140 [Chitinophagaceae bacterium MMS25-I14]
MKKLLLAILVSPLFFSSCKKSDPLHPDFSVDGVQNISINYTQANNLFLTVSPAIDTLLSNVTLSVIGVPSGISAKLSKSNGTPPFFSILSFQPDYSTLPGTYPIKVTGANQFTTKSFDMNLIVPPVNGWQVDGKTCATDSVSFQYGRFTASEAVLGSELTLSFYNHSKPVSGTYKIVQDPVGAGPQNPNEVGFQFRLNGGWSIYNPLNTNNNSMTVTVSGQTTTFTCSNVTVNNDRNSADTKTISCFMHTN